MGAEGVRVDGGEVDRAAMQPQEERGPSSERATTARLAYEPTYIAAPGGAVGAGFSRHRRHQRRHQGIEDWDRQTDDSSTSLTSAIRTRET